MPSPSQESTPALDTETVLAERRKHWINLAPVIVSTGMLILIYLAASTYYGTHTAEVSKYASASVIGLFSLMFWVLVIGIALLSFWIYRQNRVVLTNHHIVEYSRKGIFEHSISQFSLIKMQDVSAGQKGALANILGYGDITIETAGEQENFVFQQMARPQELADQIMKAHEALENASLRENRSI